ncbi:MAG: cobaltochelatase subunit CobN [Gammaproteobacteria bacterium]|nr:cobaltochelatase subunit CobN [Gammaproteobacteria bacterium]
MHLLATQPGGFVDDAEGIVRIEQDPADIVVLSAADTTLALLATVASELPDGFPSVRLANLLHLRQPASVDLYLDEVARHAQVIVVDHLGGESYWPYGTEQLVALARRENIALILFSGDHTEDPNLLQLSTVDPRLCQQLWRYLREGGATNARYFFYLLGQRYFQRPEQPLPPRPLPAIAVYQPGMGAVDVNAWQAIWRAGAPVVAVVFYRAHLQAANTAVFDALIAALQEQGLNPLPVALSSLKHPIDREILQNLCAEQAVALALNTTAFSVAAVDGEAQAPLAGDAPVLQVILSGGNREDWLSDNQGLQARDMAMHIALPEVDGRIVSRAISFKGLAYRCARVQSDVARYQADRERISFVAELSQRWCRLRTLANGEKRLALILANYPTREGRIGNGVGLDTPQSVIAILQLLREQGYAVDGVPKDGDALMAELLRGVTNDSEQWPLRPARQSLKLEDYRRFYRTLPAENRQAIEQRWGGPEQDPMLRQQRFMIAGLRLGKIFIGIQPARGYQLDPYACYHDPDLTPPHYYLAFYFWLRQVFAIDAVVHVGKHGNLEWLPGKSVALSAACWPDAILGPLPHLYPFIVNDPGEGAQAKRRTQAVIVDHLMPPLTRAESYGPLQDLERQIDEYYEALTVDPRRAVLLRRTILETIVGQQLHRELGLDDAPADRPGEDALLTKTDAYLCELKEAQIRDGLHVFGASPEGRQLYDTLLALARLPVGDGRDGNSGLLSALSHDLALGDDFDPLDAEWSAPWTGARPALLNDLSAEPWRTCGDTRERLEGLARHLLETGCNDETWVRTRQVLIRLETQVRPALALCGDQELRHLNDGLNGCFVPPGPSGAPSRGRLDVLPTGRNFYGLDSRAVPTPTAWQLGFRSAALLLERHIQDHGDYPQAVGLSVWGTATMRTGGDDIAQALALLGVRPVWASGSYRVNDFEILPLAALDRPRIDVTLRVSGFFRDAFGHVMRLFDAAVQTVAALDESPEDNRVRARIEADRQRLLQRGLAADEARRQAGWRVFGSKPGAYGAGMQGLIDQGCWEDDADLAQAYSAWGSYVYGQNEYGVSAPERFNERLGAIDLVLQNQDNREHDVLDSDDYYQFQGGMTAAVRHYSGQQPGVYHGDHSNPQAPRIRALEEEISRVIRSRVVNPKWLAGIQRHGYKGAFEIAATVDYLFAYDATARVVADHQYALVADAYVNDPAIRAFIQQHNPQAWKEICERLLEAIQRGLWQRPGNYRQQLERHLLDAEQRLESGP